MKTALYALCSVLVFTGCQNAIQKAARNTAYSAYEMIGIQKRDILKTRIGDAREEQKEASEKFEDALDKLRNMYGLKGGALERQYRKLQASYERSTDQATAVRESLSKMDTVAKDLFEEWEKEINEIQSAEYKSKSRAKLQETKSRFAELQQSLVQSEKKMQPVLVKMKDHVLYLKHNLNAQSVASLKGESTRIEGDIEKLLTEMHQSIDEADKFIKSIE